MFYQQSKSDRTAKSQPKPQSLLAFILNIHIVIIGNAINADYFDVTCAMATVVLGYTVLCCINVWLLAASNAVVSHTFPTPIVPFTKLDSLIFLLQ